MKIPEIRVIAASALAGTTMVFGGVPTALAHWGHLGELAGHGILLVWRSVRRLPSWRPRWW